MASLAPERLQRAAQIPLSAEGSFAMSTTLSWHETLAAARDDAKANNRIVLTYIHAPG